MVFEAVAKYTIKLFVVFIIIFLMDPESEVISPVSFLMLVICVFCLFIRIPRDLLVVLFVFEELAFYFIDTLFGNLLSYVAF